MLCPLRSALRAIQLYNRFLSETFRVDWLAHNSGRIARPPMAFHGPHDDRGLTPFHR
jgi:hypothetical protein